MVRFIKHEIATGEVTLAAMLHLPEGDGLFPAVPICHPHPQYGGSMHNNVVEAVADALTQRGIAALRFNFRGVGGSTGAFDNGAGEARDVLAALAWLAEQPEVDRDRVGLAGYSFGAAVATAVMIHGEPAVPVRALALVAPPVRSERLPQWGDVPCDLLVTVGDDDWVAPEEVVRGLVADLRRPVSLHVVDGADHTWLGFEHDLQAIVGPFFATKLLGETAS